MLEKQFLKPFPFVLRFFLPPRQDVTSFVYPDDFHQTQVVWLRKTRQDGLSVPSSCYEDQFWLVARLENIIVHGEIAFDVVRFCILPVIYRGCHDNGVYIYKYCGILNRMRLLASLCWPLWKTCMYAHSLALSKIEGVVWHIMKRSSACHVHMTQL